MAKRRLFEQLGIAADSIDIVHWEMPYIENLTEDKQLQFNSRKKAVTAYINTELTLTEIESRTGISQTEIYRYVKRCLKVSTNGQYEGFNALLPYLHIEPYERTTKSENGNAGKLQQLFSELPELKDYVEKLFLGKRIKGGVREPQMKFNKVHEYFLDKCAALGKFENDYPFNTENQACESLRVYLHTLKDVDIREYIQGRYGSDAAKRIDATKIDKKMENDRLLWEATKPYQEVQLDEHVIDTLMIVYIQTPNGTWVPKLCNRIWVIFLIEVVSRAILGYHVCITKYNSEDVLMTLANSIRPNWKPRTLTIPHLQYKSGAGFPSSNIESLSWRLFDRLLMDNDRCHLSHWVQERINTVLGCTINLGKKYRAETRGIIERFFKTLEERGFHRITSTTGSDIKDSRRRHPERDAIKYEVHLNEIEEILDVLTANYNATSHSACYGVSPLNYLKDSSQDSQQINRTLPHEFREHIPLFDYQFTATIRGNIKKGLHPYIQHKNVHYNNEVLSNTPSLIGKELTLVSNKLDIRIIRAYLSNGKFFGLLRASSPWNRVKHSLRTRKAIIKCINDGKIMRNDSDPIRSYNALLSKKSLSSRRERNKLVRFERETEVSNELEIENPYLHDKPIQNQQKIIHRKGWIKIT